MFEKIHSHQLKKSLKEMMGDTNEFMLPISNHEKRWLKAALQNEAATLFFKGETMEKLEPLLAEIVESDPSLIVEKGTSKPLGQQDDIASIHQRLRHGMANKQAFLLSYRLNDGDVIEGAEGFPYKLEFYVQKQQWYVLWVKKQHDVDYLISTPLPHLLDICWKKCSEAEYRAYLGLAEQLVDGGKRQATIALNPKTLDESSVDQHRHRIFYAFSCFDKEIVYDEEEHHFEIIVYYRETEKYDLLQKLRFLGKRVVVKEPEELRRMLQKTAIDALKRYGE
ncbi:WYL domain-containing protein [Neobacillus sp. Marseille-QA0830]